MEIEERLGKLEENARQQLAGDLAMAQVLRALIANHPDRAAVTASFQKAVAFQQAAVQDLGFDTGRRPDIAQGVMELLQEKCGDWLRLLQS